MRVKEETNVKSEVTRHAYKSPFRKSAQSFVAVISYRFMDYGDDVFLYAYTHISTTMGLKYPLKKFDSQ